MVREVETAALAAAARDGALVVDVREPDEYTAGHVPGAVNIPLGVLPVRTGELPKNGRVFVVCASGGRSAQGAQLLSSAGLDAVNVLGGTGAWTRAGHPVITGTRPNVS
jgi:rhodanese-related sulfurtransferase